MNIEPRSGRTWPAGEVAAVALALALPLALPAPEAHAQLLGNLPFGVHFDLEACMEGDNDACDRGALEIGHAGWEAFLLREDPPESLQGDDLAVYHNLGCAAWETDSCTALGHEARDRGDRFRAAMQYVWSCTLVDQEACAQFTLPRDQFSSADGIKSELIDYDRETYGLRDQTPPDVKTLKKIAARCDGKKGTLDDCVTLARTYNNQFTVADRQTVEQGLDEVCTKHGSTAACSLLSDIRGIDRHWDPRMQASMELMADLCSQGSVEKACFATARALDSGKGLASSSYGSRRFYGYACDGGETDGCERLTQVYQTGCGPMIEDTCRRVRNGEGGDPRACTETHTMYTFGVGAEQNESMAEKVKHMACENGDLRPCVWLGNDAWGADDKQAAAEWYRKACDAGDSISCGVFGRMILKGEANLAQDQAGGIALLQKSCDGNAGNGCFELGFSYSQARGVSRDNDRATDLYAKSCSLGYMNGCSSLGVMYMDGRGVTANGAYSKWLLNYACDGGFGSACRNMGNAYRDGLQGYELDDERARWAYRRGCELEHEGACESLALIGEEGEVREPEEGTRPPYEGTYTATTYTPTTPSTPSGPTGPSPPPPPSWSRDPRARGYFSFGTERSWSALAQASTLRGGFLVELGPLGVGMDFDWNTDNRWRPKIARGYQRIGMWGTVALVLPIGGGAALDIGGGGGLGTYREGPGKTTEPIFSAGVKEFIQFNAFVDSFLLGVRIEQQQLFQEHPSMPLDHVTAVYAVIGGQSER